MVIPEEPFIPRRGLRGGHAQTLAGNFLPRESRLMAPEARLFRVADDVQLLCHCNWQAERTAAPTVIVVHGLEGSSDSQYMVGVANKAFAAGMNAIRLNMRNCGGTEQLTPTLYHSGLSGDIGAVVRTLIAEDGLKRIGLVGYSMGGNLVLKLAGDLGTTAPPELRGVVGVSPAMDLGPSCDALHSPRNRVYEWRFMRGLRARLRRKAQHFPDRYDATKLRGVWSVREFDDKITAPCSGFTGAEDYYYRAASARVLDKIAVPTLVIHAEDDPFIRITPETRAKLVANPHITFVETKHGGHCAFLAAPNGYDGRWAERTAVAFLKSRFA